MIANRIYKYNETAGNDDCTLVTKKYDMGQPSVRKKVRRFYVSFSGNQDTIADLHFEYSIDDDPFEEISLLDYEHVNNNLWMFDLPRSLTAYWIQLRISGNIQYDIQDISIIYRPKLPK